MTGTALAVEVIGGLVGGMARRAVDLAGVIERGRLPGRRCVTRRALARKVIGGLIHGVTGQTLALPGMIETRREPCIGDVTQTALAFEVRLRLVLCMA